MIAQVRYAAGSLSIAAGPFRFLSQHEHVNPLRCSWTVYRVPTDHRAPAEKIGTLTTARGTVTLTPDRWTAPGDLPTQADMDPFIDAAAHMAAALAAGREVSE